MAKDESMSFPVDEPNDIRELKRRRPVMEGFETDNRGSPGPGVGMKSSSVPGLLPQNAYGGGGIDRLQRPEMLPREMLHPTTGAPDAGMLHVSASGPSPVVPSPISDGNPQSSQDMVAMIHQLFSSYGKGGGNTSALLQQLVMSNNSNVDQRQPPRQQQSQEVPGPMGGMERPMPAHGIAPRGPARVQRMHRAPVAVPSQPMYVGSPQGAQMMASADQQPFVMTPDEALQLLSNHATTKPDVRELLGGAQQFLSEQMMLQQARGGGPTPQPINPSLHASQRLEMGAGLSYQLLAAQLGEQGPGEQLGGNLPRYDSMDLFTSSELPEDGDTAREDEPPLPPRGAGTPDLPMALDDPRGKWGSKSASPVSAGEAGAGGSRAIVVHCGSSEAPELQVHLPGAKGQKIHPGKSIAERQSLWVRYGDDEVACPATAWCKPASAPLGQDPMSVSMHLTQEPSNWHQPNSANCAFKPNFTVTMDVTHNAALTFECKIRAYVVVQEQVDGLPSWTPNNHRQSDDVQDDEVSATITVPAPAAEGETTKVTQQFAFQNFRFKQSSRMKRKYMLFVWSSENDSFMFLLYHLPTIVLSRRHDQQDKAMAILHGAPVCDKRKHDPVQQAASATAAMDSLHLGSTVGAGPSLAATPVVPMKGSYTRASFREEVLNAYRQWFKRPFQAEDMEFLYDKAGFGCARALDGDREPDEEELASGPRVTQCFSWFHACLNSLKQCRDLWDYPTYLLICGFRISREKAEAVLGSQPLGTFLIRLQSEGGGLVISTKTNSNKHNCCSHTLIDLRDLQTRKMEIWVRDTPDANFFLDVRSFNRIPKEKIFIPKYQRLRTVQRPFDSAGNSNTTTSTVPSNGGRVPPPPLPLTWSGES